MLTILPTYYYYPSWGTTKGRRVPMQYAPCTYLSPRDGGMHYAVVTRLLTTIFIFLHSLFHSSSPLFSRHLGAVDCLCRYSSRKPLAFTQIFCKKDDSGMLGC